jgi:hypothetical protein
MAIKDFHRAYNTDTGDVSTPPFIPTAADWKAMFQKIDILTAMVQELKAKNGSSDKMTEEEVLALTGYKSTSTLKRLRQYGVLTGKTSTGKNIMYSRKEVMQFMNGELANRVFAMNEKIKEEQLQKQQTA